jgi:hypothetical protein
VKNLTHCFGASLRLRQFWSERRVTPRILVNPFLARLETRPPVESAAAGSLQFGSKSQRMRFHIA